jgi:hypothetical protein
MVLPGAAGAFALGPISVRIEKGSRARLGFQIGKRAWKLARRARRAGRKVRIRVTLTARDGAGNATTAQRTIAFNG